MLEDNKTLQLKKNEQSSYKIVITKEMERKIRFICQKVSQVEWSGVMYYTHTGNFEDGSLTIIAKDLIVLDIGTGGATEFKCSNPDVCTYMIENDLLDCDMGLIHSHNNMATFFSGTDTATLRQEGSDRNIFVSLIVNNEGTYTAGITRQVFSKISEEICYKTWRDKEICNPVEHYETKYVEWFNLAIEKEKDNSNPFPEIAERLLNIAEEKKKAEEDAKKLIRYNPNPYPWMGDKQTTLFDDDADVPPADYKPFKQKETKHIQQVNENFAVDTELFDDIVMKLLTGDINADTSSMTTSAAAINMPLKFDRTFKDISDFESFASNMLDFIIDTWGPFVYMPNDDKKEELWDEALGNFAYDLGSRLIQIVPNKYTEIYSNLLNNYM